MTRDELITRHMRTAEYFAGKFRIPGMDPADVLQEALTVLCESADSYRPTVGCAFSTFVSTRIRNHLVNRVRYAAYRDHESLDGPGAVEPMGRGADPAEWAERADDVAKVAKALSHLPGRQREIVVLHADGMKRKELAGRYRVSYAAVGDEARAAMKALRQFFDVKELPAARPIVRRDAVRRGVRADLRKLIRDASMPDNLTAALLNGLDGTRPRDYASFRADFKAAVRHVRERYDLDGDTRRELRCAAMRVSSLGR